MIPTTIKSACTCEIQSVAINASFAVWAIVVVVVMAAVIVVAVINLETILLAAVVMLLELAVPVSYSVDAMSDALVNELAGEIIDFVPNIGVCAAVTTALEFAVPMSLAEFGC